MTRIFSIWHFALIMPMGECLLATESASTTVRILRWASAFILLGGLFSGLVGAAVWLGAADNVPLERVRIDGDIRHTSRAALQRTLAGRLTGSFFSLDLNAVRAALEDLPWITRASVRRVWPATLMVTVEERRALARWGESGIISPEGEIFTPEPDSVPEGLAVLTGPLDSAQKVAQSYAWMRRQLNLDEMDIAGLQLSARHAWTLELTDGTRLYFGNRELEQRFALFLKHYPPLTAQGRVEQMDFRYTNGFAVRWGPPGPGVEAREMGMEG